MTTQSVVASTSVHVQQGWTTFGPEKNFEFLDLGDAGAKKTLLASAIINDSLRRRSQFLFFVAMRHTIIFQI